MPARWSFLFAVLATAMAFDAVLGKLLSAFYAVPFPCCRVVQKIATVTVCNGPA